MGGGGPAPLEGQLNIQHSLKEQTKKKLNGLSPQENYTDRATASSRRSEPQRNTSKII
jgi:hypothetical protein